MVKDLMVAMKRAILSFMTLFPSLLAFFAAADSPDRKTLRFGVVLGLTGPAAAHAAAIQGGITLATEDLRTQGWTIDMDVQDDQTLPSRTVSSVQYLLSHGQRFIIGPTWSFLVKAARPALEQANAIALVPGGSSDIVGGPSPALFNLSPLRTAASHPVAEWLTTNHLKKALILTSNGDWGETHRTMFRAALTQANVENAGEEQFDFGVDPTFFSTLFNQSAFKDVDVILTTGTAADVANVVRARNLLKLSVAVLTTDHIRDALRMNLLKQSDVSNASLVGLPVAESWKVRFHGRYPDLPDLYSDRAYDAVIILSKAIEQTDGSVEAVRRYLREDLSYRGPSGDVKFDSSGNGTVGRYRVISAAAASD